MSIYRGFNFNDIYNLIKTKQAEALGHGPGVEGALNWIDNCRRATGLKLEGNKRQDLIQRLISRIETHRVEES
jgi:hypothetical protein